MASKIITLAALTLCSCDQTILDRLGEAQTDVLILEGKIDLLEEQLAKLQVLHDYDTKHKSMVSRVQTVVLSTLAERHPNSTKVKQPNPHQIVQISQAVARYSEVFSLPPELVLAVIRQESGFDPKALSHAGAQGLMQLMPMTALSISRELHMGTTYKIWDIKTNIMFGCYYLRKMMLLFPGEVKLALAAYNAGPQYILRKVAETANDETDGNKEQFYQETEDYIMNIPNYIDLYKEQLWSKR